jgi:hypothetical protein
MRTFEVLVSGALLVTTNEWIKETEFYNPDYIVILENNFEIANKVAEIQSKIEKNTSKTALDLEKFQKYYIDNWVNEFFA